MIESERILIEKSDEKIFNFVSNFNNFIHLMPNEVKDLKVTEKECSFSINGMPTIHLAICDKVPYSLVSMNSENDKLDFKLNCCLEKIDSNNCYVQFQFDAQLNAMMKMMVSKPLTQFLNVLVQKLKEIKL